MKNPNSALFWLPPVASSGIRCPRTKYVRFDASDLLPILDDALNDYLLTTVVEQIDEAAQEIGYPVFIRNDQTSAKHGGPKAYKAESKADIPRIIYRSFEDWAFKGIPVFPEAFLVRQFLNIEHDFTAFNGHPVGREYRFFAGSQPPQTLCNHFYWTEDAVADHGAGYQNGPNIVSIGPDEARRLVWAMMTNTNHGELDVLRATAALAAAHLPQEPYWSVDFARDVNGVWWLIDMAVARQSWHPEDCPMAKALRASPAPEVEQSWLDRVVDGMDVPTV